MCGFSFANIKTSCTTRCLVPRPSSAPHQRRMRVRWEKGLGTSTTSQVKCSNVPLVTKKWLLLKPDIIMFTSVLFGIHLGGVDYYLPLESFPNRLYWVVWSTPVLWCLAKTCQNLIFISAEHLHPFLGPFLTGTETELPRHTASETDIQGSVFTDNRLQTS